jgi:hypothetical protein
VVDFNRRALFTSTPDGTISLGACRVHPFSLMTAE